MDAEIRWARLTTPNRKRYERPYYDEYQVWSGGKILYRSETRSGAEQWCEQEGCNYTLAASAS